MRAIVTTIHGSFEVDVEDEEVLGPADEPPPPDPLAELGLPRVVAAAAAGATVVAVVDRRPPLAISHDAGQTWHEAGGGLPAGRAVDVASDDPDLVLYGARNRLFVSHDGGRFWRVLTPELPEILRVTWTDAGSATDI